MKISALPLALFVTLASCSQEFKVLLPSQQVQRHAPLAVNQTGHLVHGISKADLYEFLRQHPKSRLRTLYPKQGFYEVFTEHPEALPNSVKNKFITNDLVETDPDDFLSQCDDAPQEAPFQIVTSENRELGASVLIKPIADKDFQFYFSFSAPKGSLLKDRIEVGRSFEFVADQSGYYRISVIGKKLSQETSTFCWRKNQLIEITENPPYVKKLLSDDDLKRIDLSPYWFLKNLNWNFNPQDNQGEGVKIAIIDSGLNYNHIALSSSLSLNTSEIPDNNIDDDNNGFIDDSYGYDFVDQDARPFDRNGHGTHVAALAASPIMGVARKAEILPIRAFNGIGYDVGTITAAIYYAVDSGAKIINLSAGWKGDPKDPAYAPMIAAIDYANSHKAILVVASGNGNAFGIGENLDEQQYIPSSFKSANIISVAALDKDDSLTEYSNYGKNTVHISAPGGSMNRSEILSANKKTADGELWVYKSGTSQAAPMVSGALAILKSNRPLGTTIELFDQLVELSTFDADLARFTIHGRRLDFSRFPKSKSTGQLSGPFIMTTK